MRPIGIGQALNAAAGSRVVVRGALHVDSGHVRLCARLDASYPPQCAGRSLRVHGLVYSDVEGLQTSPDESTHWAEELVVSGRIEPDGTLQAE